MPIQHVPGCQPFRPAEPATIQKGVGIVGLHEGKTLLRAMDRVTRARAVAACDLDPDKRADAACSAPEVFVTADYDDLLARPDVEIVAIYTPDAHHGEHVERAFAAGKDVLCTKPLVNSIEDARRIRIAGERTGKKLMVGQSTRFFLPFARQRQDYERGAIGKVELVDCHYVHRMDWFYEKSPWAATDTDWVFLGLSHPVDLLSWYLGPIEEVHAFASRSTLGERYKLQGRDVYIVNAIAENGVVGRAMGHYGGHELPTARNSIELMLWGADGTSQAQYHDMKYRHVGRDGTEITEDPLYAQRHWWFNSEVHGMHYGEFAAALEHFAGALIDGTPHHPDLREGLQTFCVMEAIRRSAHERRPVRVGDVAAEVAS